MNSDGDTGLRLKDVLKGDYVKVVHENPMYGLVTGAIYQIRSLEKRPIEANAMVKLGGNSTLHYLRRFILVDKDGNDLLK
jgi:hypothetical protein